MTRDETKGLLQKIQVHYWRFFKDMPREYVQITLDEWYRFLQKYDVDKIVQALDLCIVASEFPPTIKDIVDKIPAITRKIQIEKSINTPLLESDSAIPMPEDVKEKLSKFME